MAENPDDTRDRRVLRVAKRSDSRPGPVRIFYDWTPSALRSAERAAEQGNLHYAASICDWLLGDDRVAGTLSARTDSLMGLEPSFEAGVGRRAKQAMKALEAGEDWWEAYPESEITQLLQWGILLGVAPSRHQWIARADHGGRVLPMPRFWHPQTLRWDWQQRRWTVRDERSVELEVVAGDGEWILHTPFGSDRPWAYGLWRSLSRWALLKQFAMSDWARHSEKGSLLVATSPEGATQQQRKELAQDLAAAGEDPVVALGNGFDLKLIEVTADTQAIYEAQIKMADLAIAIRVRGANLSTEVKEGSRAAAQAQAKTGDNAKLRFDAASISTTLHDQSLVWWAEFNFGDRKLAPWPVYPVEPEEDKKERAEMVETLGKGLETFDKLGFEIDEKALVEEFGLTFISGRPRETRVDPEPAPPPVPGDEPPKTDKKSARALASGAAAAANTGFVDGQLYADDVVDDARAKAGKQLSAGFIADLLAAIDSEDSYEAIRAAVLKRYGDSASPQELRDILQKALVLGDLAGAAAVRQDA